MPWPFVPPWEQDDTTGPATPDAASAFRHQMAAANLAAPRYGGVPGAKVATTGSAGTRPTYLPSEHQSPVPKPNLLTALPRGNPLTGPMPFKVPGPSDEQYGGAWKNLGPGQFFPQGEPPPPPPNIMEQKQAADDPYAPPVAVPKVPKAQKSPWYNKPGLAGGTIGQNLLWGLFAALAGPRNAVEFGAGYTQSRYGTFDQQIEAAKAQAMADYRKSQLDNTTKRQKADWMKTVLGTYGPGNEERAARMFEEGFDPETMGDMPFEITPGGKIAMNVLSEEAKQQAIDEKNELRPILKKLKETEWGLKKQQARELESRIWYMYNHKGPSAILDRQYRQELIKKIEQGDIPEALANITYKMGMLGVARDNAATAAFRAQTAQYSAESLARYRAMGGTKGASGKMEDYPLYSGGVDSPQARQYASMGFSVLVSPLEASNVLTMAQHDPDPDIAEGLRIEMSDPGYGLDSEQMAYVYNRYIQPANIKAEQALGGMALPSGGMAAGTSKAVTGKKPPPQKQPDIPMDKRGEFGAGMIFQNPAPNVNISLTIPNQGGTPPPAAPPAPPVRPQPSGWAKRLGERVNAVDAFLRKTPDRNNAAFLQMMDPKYRVMGDARYPKGRMVTLEEVKQSAAYKRMPRDMQVTVLEYVKAMKNPPRSR